MDNVVFFVGNISTNGGTERVTSIIANNLSQKYNIKILSIDGDIANLFFPLSDSIRITILRKTTKVKTLKLSDLILQIRKFNSLNSTDIFISVESMLALYGIPATLGTSIKHIVWEHFNFKTDLGRFERRVARYLSLIFADKIITLTKQDKGYWIDASFIRRASVTCIPNPVNFVPQVDYNSQSKVIISVGRLTKQKGFDLLVDSWYKVNSKLRNDWNLKIIGDGPERDSLQKKIEEHNLEDSIELIPATKEVFQYYSNASIYCLSSRYEGLPMVLLEALAYQLPIIAFDCETGPRDVVDDQVNGILVYDGDTKALALSLSNLMSDSVERKRMSQETRNKLADFEINSVIDRWCQVLDEK